MQQIDLERRQKSLDVADKMYTKLMKQIPTKHDKYRNMKTWIAMKYARFQFKVCNDVEKVKRENLNFKSLVLTLFSFLILHH